MARRRGLGLLVVGSVCLSVLAACEPSPQRYRDPVFSDVAVTKDIVYGQALDEDGILKKLKLDLYQPEGDSLSARPVFIWIHGGGFHGGSKDVSGNRRWAFDFAQRGYVAAAIDYRVRDAPLEGERLRAAIIDAQHDAQAAVRWFRANAAAHRIDAHRIVVVGGSAGAVTALNVNFRSHDPGASGNPGYPSTVSAAVSISGATDPAVVDPEEPPIFMAHGDRDTTVPYQLARDLCQAALDASGVCEFHTYPHGHGVGGEFRDDILPKVVDFLVRHVVSSSPAPG